MYASEKSDKVRLLNGDYTGGYAHPLHSQGDYLLKSMKGGDAYEK